MYRELRKSISKYYQKEVQFKKIPGFLSQRAAKANTVSHQRETEVTIIGCFSHRIRFTISVFLSIFLLITVSNTNVLPSNRPADVKS